jgi:hypothetical protein
MHSVPGPSNFIFTLIVTSCEYLYVYKTNVLAIVNKQTVYLCFFHFLYMTYLLSKKGKNVSVENVKTVRVIRVLSAVHF